MLKICNEYVCVTLSACVHCDKKCTLSQVVEKKQSVMNLEHLQENRFRQIVSRFQQLNDALAILAPIQSVTSKDMLVLHGVVNTNTSNDLIDDLSWLREVQHIAFFYLRAENGVRVVFSDGVFCELYLHEPQDLQSELPPDLQLNWQLSGYKLAGFPNIQVNTRAVSYTHLTLPTNA